MKPLVFLSALALVAGLATTATVPASASDGWLVQETDADKRAEMLQDQFGGFSAAMREVGDRWVLIHAALERENLDLAKYHWEKLNDAIGNGLVRRPGRKTSADVHFPDGFVREVREHFDSGEVERAWRGFEDGRSACLACHVAEEVGFINVQAMFDLRAPDAR